MIHTSSTHYLYRAHNEETRVLKLKIKQVNLNQCHVMSNIYI